MFFKKDIQRFWAYAGKRDGDLCWIWQGGLYNPNGYGQFWFQGRNLGAHVFSLEIKLGRRLVEGECSLHECDIKQCVNPNHLFLGTKGLNNTDRKKKGRNSNRKGTNNQCAKLVEEDVVEIRRLYDLKQFTLAALAEMFSVTDMTIFKIGKREHWKHIQEVGLP